MGGCIAYLGDLIGRRLGKRRASLFRLRPRHTAVLVTTITGFFISLSTMAVLFIAVQPVRRVILEGEAAIRKNRQLQAENLRLAAASERAQRARMRAVAARDAAEAERSRTEAALRSARAELAGVRSVLEQTRRAADQARSALARVEGELQRARAEVARERASATKLAALNDQLRHDNEKLQEDAERLRATNDELAVANEELVRANASYSQENEAVSSQNEALVRERDSLSSVVADLRRQQQDLAQQTEKLRGEYNDLLQSYTTAYGAHRSLWEMFEALRTRRIVVQGGEELARVVIPPGTPAEGVRQAIDGLLSEAHREAIRKGAAPGERVRAVQIVDRRFATPTPTGVATVRVTEQERVDAVVARVARSEEPICILAVAVANSIEGEPAAIDLQPLANRLVYRKGQIVSTRRLDTSQPAGALFDEIVSMLKGIGRSAVERGLIPRFDPVTGEPQTGSLTARELVDLTARVRGEAGRRVELAAIAAADTMAADTLQLEFRVRPVH